MTVTPEDNTLPSRALAMLQGFLDAAGLDARAEIRPQDDEGVTLAVAGPDAACLVGPRGQYLDALQHLLLLMVRHTRDQRPRLTVDADGYRARRAETLSRFARELAAQVAANGEEAVTDPLNPMERRIVHTALVDHPDVTTYSEGEEPNRYVVVTPRPDSGGGSKS
ncbi:MAG: KH domain-containing protein [Armatimonadetes bacterium]|nr:KH domain-containing protein [Armatimonadota bacterium]